MNGLELDDLTVGYRGHRVLSGVTVEAAPGELTVLVGPNGTGKSTLLRTVAGLQPPIGGSVRWAGDDLLAMSPAQRALRLAVVPTGRAETGLLTAAVGAEHLAERWAGELADGERQRVLARALAGEPAVLLLDEPSAVLDVSGRVGLLTLLRRLARGGDLCVVVSTHDLESALRLADRIWLADRSGTVRTGTPEQLVADGSIAAAVGGRDGPSAWGRTTAARPPRRASDAQVSAALDAAAAIGPFFAVSTGPTGAGVLDPPGWTGLREPLAPLVDDVAERLGTSERRVATSIMFQTLAARLVSPVVAALEQGIVLDLDPASTTVRSRPGEALGVHCTRPGGWVSTSAQLVASVVVERQLRPIVVALAAEAAEGLLWGNVASALVGALTVMRAGPGSVAFSVVRELLELGPLAGRLDERFRRRSCCLFYRAVPEAYCGDCALVDRGRGGA